jgi:branched-subunit amino acid transport protein
MRTMATQNRVRKALPRWVSGILGGLPGLAAVLTLVVMNFTGRNQIFNLSARDSYLVAGIGSVLVGTVLSLSVLCIILIGRLR